MMNIISFLDGFDNEEWERGRMAWAFVILAFIFEILWGMKAIFWRLVWIPVLFTSCVSAGKYNEMSLLRDYYKSELDKRQAVESRSRVLEEELREKESALTDAREQLARLSGRFVQLEGDHQTLEERIEDLRDQNETLTLAMSRRESEWRDSVRLYAERINEAETNLTRLKLEFSGDAAISDSILAHLSNREKELIAFRTKRDQEAEQLVALRERVAERMSMWPDTSVGWRLEGETLMVAFRNQWLYSGTDAEDLSLSDSGRRALRRLSELIADVEGLAIEVRYFDEEQSAGESMKSFPDRSLSIHQTLTASGFYPENIYLRPVPRFDTPTPEELLTGNQRTVLLFSFSD